MALKVEVELSRINNITVDDSASGAVARFIRFMRSSREKSNMVPFTYYNNGDLRWRIYTESVTSSYN